VSEPRSIGIVGGGIAGLSAAHWLVRNRPSVNVTLLESGARLGGKILTERVQNFVVEAGPDSFLASKPEGLALCRELGIEDQLVSSIAENRGSFVALDGELHALPEGMSGLIPTRIDSVMTSSLFSEAGKERFAEEPMVPARTGDGDESLAQFVERRFGMEAYSNLIEPLLAGIYAGDGRELSLTATFPQLRNLEETYGSVLRGLEATASAPERREDTGMASREAGDKRGFVTPRKGMGEIVAAVQPALRSADVRLGAQVRAIRRRNSGFQLAMNDGEYLEMDAVIVATPAHVSAQLLSDLDVELSHELMAIPYVSSATVSLAFLREQVPHPLHGYGYIIPRVSGSPLLACTWVSSKYPSRAPERHVLLRVFVGRRGMEAAVELGNEQIVELVRDELRNRLGIKAKPELERVHRWPEGMPQYTLGHPQRVNRIGRLVANHAHLHVAGNSYQGVGVPDCIRSGELAAAAAVS
jgi:protoporphyrinogen/coproporphyrinogen III oxidase